MKRKNTKIVTVEDIKSDLFKTKKEFNEQYKIVKEEFKRQLGFNIMKQGLITLCVTVGKDNYMMVTSSTKYDMIDYINKFSGRDFFLLIEGQDYLVKGV